MDLVVQDLQSDTGQELEDMEEVSLIAVSSGGELYWERSGESQLFGGHGWIGSMERGQLKRWCWLERGWNTVGSGRQIGASSWV